MGQITYVGLVIKYPDNELARYIAPQHPSFDLYKHDPHMVVCDEIRDNHGIPECVWRENGVTLVTSWPLEAVVSMTYLEEALNQWK